MVLYKSEVVASGAEPWPGRDGAGTGTVCLGKGKKFRQRPRVCGGQEGVSG